MSDLTQPLTPARLKETIFLAFKDVRKGTGRGVRHCTALDGQDDAPGEDTEEHWWEYPDELKDSRFANALFFNNVDGIRFHLPAQMTAAIEGGSRGWGLSTSVHMILCEQKVGVKAPHNGHRPYLDYLKSIDIHQTISHYGFTKEQVQAIALFLFWDTHPEFEFAYPLDDRDAMIAYVKTNYENVVRSVAKANYSLTFEEAVAIEDEKRRILEDWFTAGSIDPDTPVVKRGFKEGV